jgi:hypothetical protein
MPATLGPVPIALAQAHAAPAAFNGLFFAPTATVIPVMFLAIAVQGRTFEDLLDAQAAGLRQYRKEIRELRASGQLTLGRAFGGGGPNAQLLGCITALIPFAGIWCEFWSLDSTRGRLVQPPAWKYF